jgi:hypothetical protein
MTFTVVPAVREAEAPTSEPGQKLQVTMHRAMPLRPATMDLPYAEQVIRLDFGSGDFARTIPGGLS